MGTGDVQFDTWAEHAKPTLSHKYQAAQVAMHVKVSRNCLATAHSMRHAAALHAIQFFDVHVGLSIKTLG